MDVVDLEKWYDVPVLAVLKCDHGIAIFIRLLASEITTRALSCHPVPKPSWTPVSPIAYYKRVEYPDRGRSGRQ